MIAHVMDGTVPKLERLHQVRFHSEIDIYSTNHHIPTQAALFTQQHLQFFTSLGIGRIQHFRLQKFHLNAFDRILE